MNNFSNKPAFVNQTLEEDKPKNKGVILTVRLNEEELELLKQVKKAIEQPKDSTALKTLFYIGAFDVLHDKKTAYIVETLFKNKRNNERNGLSEIE
jgi:hypothetical protein